jgi:hypothetical protein
MLHLLIAIDVVLTINVVILINVITFFITFLNTFALS